jgi:predicted DNA-binding protein
MTERLNARIDAELARKVRYLRQRTGQSTTEVVRRSIEAYFEDVRALARPADLLHEFVGCAKGRRDLSTRYKDLLTQSLSKKTR